MNSKQMARYKTVLEQKRDELAEDYESTRTRSSQGPDEGDKDYIDYAVSSYTKEFLYSLTDMERNQLIQVDQALRAIDDGTYGTCDECGEPIEEKRLKAVPWATYCLGCQELADRGVLVPRDRTRGGEEE